ncbi:hypothetical protein [Azotobacter vinelandii]|uniref:hypothetical protein n=1 Tax=Azotobacter vinelandii TaxID=354 RepID=UPI00091035BF|nr:hypothetical protein [Azotobacter vinelandii]SFY16330.1 hypothetical protein SAMN04244547_04258 [Azotobacter vinelandii]
MVKQLSASVVEAGDSPPLVVYGLRKMTISVIPSGTSSAKCQYTTSSLRDVLDGQANWIDWPNGYVSSPTTDAFLFRVMAVRLSATGPAKLEIIENDK